MSVVIAILVFSFVVFFHELGHFLLAKKNGIVVEEFSIGMGPRIVSCVHKGTRYSLKLFPIGGSCAMLGEDSEDVQEGAFNECNVWGRLSTIFAGPFFNFILAFFLACIIMGADGYYAPMVSKVDEQSASYLAGLRPGDKIAKFNGETIRFYGDLGIELYMHPITDELVTMDVVRDGELVKLTFEPDRQMKYRMGFDYTDDETELIVDSVTKDSPIYEAGIRVGDHITSFNGQSIQNGRQFREFLSENPLDGSTVQIEYIRKGTSNIVEMTPVQYESFDTGFSYTAEKVEVSGFGILSYGFYDMMAYIKTTYKSLYLLVTGKLGTDQLGGPVAVVSNIGSSVKASSVEGLGAVLINVLNWGIMLSANLGVMNLIPFPALDGGRIVFLLIEAITRKPLNRKLEGMVHMIGFMLLMLLMVYVFYNDIMRLI